MNKSIFLLFFCIAVISSFSKPSIRSSYDPTGTYILKGEKHRGEIKGQYAEVRAKLLGDSILALTMYCNKGFPEYTSGSFHDTLMYVGNKAVYASRNDPTCKVVFAFEVDKLHINQVYSDPLATCGFARGVLPLGFIEKYSSEIPIIQPISRLE